MKLNLGCGSKDIKKGFINIDYQKFEGVDMVLNLNKFPYPFPDNSVDFINADHLLEHLQEPEAFWFEVYRILKKGARIRLTVPHKDTESAYSTFGHRGFYHENAIKVVCGNPAFPKFKHITTKIARGRFKKWQKRQILWVVEK